ncbi:MULTISPECIES: hypothetical protein [unclassified Oceanispirochaeta]|uniref:hypothetical protein n=1 Tax=unclassified Oceanispirochaeta TaxID=2635722 RepID=UPI000E090170|nr:MULTISPECIES: hypothetical protein [unclassified Oceanispirochaeta]MBF9016579.1 hypothetical protein [Oceanispirochaeta sp. M2]NPD73042.1 hypothetical protein [Oceanispirochaeta sp. M1]RDG31388.1 hypothetical protein DV872_13130 [Oceanispirochaeta sp. M1]
MDISKYEAYRLQADAEAQFAAGDFEESLTGLFTNQPGLMETTTGRPLFTEIEPIDKIKSDWINRS